MSKIAQKKVLVVVLTLLLFFLAGSVFALEVNYPRVPGMQETPKECLELPVESEERLACFVKYIYHFSLTISGLVCFFAIFSGGILYLISGSSVGKVKDARERISAGFLGTALLLCSYLILYVFNPQLIILHFKSPEIPEDGELIEMEPYEPGIPVYVEIPYGNRIERLKTVIEIANTYAMQVYFIGAEEEPDNNHVSITEFSRCLKELTDQCRCGPTLNCEKDRTPAKDACTIGECQHPCDWPIEKDFCQSIDQLIVLPVDLTDPQERANLREAIRYVTRRIEQMTPLMLQAERNLKETRDFLEQELTKLEAAEFLMSYSINLSELYDTPINRDNFRVLQEREKVQVKRLRIWQD